MAVCTFEGNSDMYGLGIRLGFYLQWFGVILAAWIARGEVQGLWFANDFFVAATFLALVIQVSRNVQSLQVVEVYIILLLMFGAYLYVVPVYIWRFFTRCNPYWDPTRWPIIRESALHSNLRLMLEFAVLGLQFWFWFSRVQDLKGEGCEQFGFFFAKIRLNNTGFVAINILLYFMLAAICLILVFVKMVSMLGIPQNLTEHDDRVSDDVERRIRILRNLNSLSNIIVASIITAATELTIHWNHITGVNSLAAAGQTIPFVIGLGAVIRIFYVYFFHSGNDDGGNGEDPHDNEGPREPTDWTRPPRYAARPPPGSRSPRTAARPTAWHDFHRVQAPPRGQYPHNDEGPRGPTDWARPPRQGRQPARSRSPRTAQGPSRDFEECPPRRPEVVSIHGARREQRREQSSPLGPRKVVVEEDIVEMDWERQGWVRRHRSRSQRDG